MVYCMLVSIQDAKVDLLRREECEQVAMMCLKMKQWEVEENSQGPLGDRSGLAKCDEQDMKWEGADSGTARKSGANT